MLLAKSNSWRSCQLTGKMNADTSTMPISPLPFSSVVHFGDTSEFAFCSGILIAPKYAMADGSCGESFVPFGYVS